jgi:hypothetical protein
MSLRIDGLGTPALQYEMLKVGYCSRFGQRRVRKHSDYAAHDERIAKIATEIDEHRHFALEESFEFDVRGRRRRFAPSNSIRVVIASDRSD